MTTNDIYDVPAGVPVNSSEPREWVAAFLRAFNEGVYPKDDLAAWFSCIMAAGREQQLDEQAAMPLKADPTRREPDPLTRGEITDRAGMLISGNRENEYGSPKESFEKTARLWTEIIEFRIEPWQVPLMLAALKMARITTSPQRADNWVDLAGYAALGGEVAYARDV